MKDGQIHHIKELNDKGFTYLRGKLSKKEIDEFKPEIDSSFEKHYKIQISNLVENPTKGIALNCLADSEKYLSMLEHITTDSDMQILLENLLGKDFILNSFSCLTTLKGNPNFSINVHRDNKEFSKDYVIMVNVLVMLDNFLPESGPTLLLPYSHKSEDKPSDVDFQRNAIKANGSSGDVLIFNSNVWHSSSPNLNQLPRRSIAMTFSKPFVKQLVDYTKMLQDKHHLLSEHMRKILGYNHRVAESLEQWYVPIEQRMYKKSY